MGLEKDSQAHWQRMCEVTDCHVESKLTHTYVHAAHIRVLEEKTQGLDLGPATFQLCVFTSLRLDFLI